MTEQPKLNILDAMADAMASKKDVRALLTKRAEELVDLQLDGRTSLVYARKNLQDELIEFLKTRNFVGKGTKKLVDKAVATALHRYETRLRAALQEELAEAKRDLKDTRDWTRVILEGRVRDIEGRLKGNPSRGRSVFNIRWKR